MPSYRVSEKAKKDIRAIGIYTQNQWGREQRRKYLSDLEWKFQFLAETSRFAGERKEFSPPVRIHHLERHWVVYVRDEHGILIVRVLHDAMNVPTQMAEPS